MALESTASVVGIAGVAIQLFQGCVEGYKIWHTARHIGQDGDLLYTKFIVQYTRLDTWAYKAGVSTGSPKRLQWEPILLILAQQNQLLHSAKELQQRYRLQEPLTKTNSEPLSTGEALTQELEKPGAGAPHLVERVKGLLYGDRKTRQEEASGILKRNSFIRRIGWAVQDKKRLERIIADITELNSQLVEYLDKHDQEQFRREVRRLFRALISECKDSSEVENIQQSIEESMPANVPNSILAAARIKTLRLTLKLDKRDDEVPAATEEAPFAMNEFKHYKANKLMSPRDAELQGTKIATYNATVVLIEWRTITANWSSLHPSLRSLAMLLCQARDSAFHSLPCTGYVEDEASGRFGFVYDVSDFATGADSSTVRNMSLFDLIAKVRFVSQADRMRIACDTAEAVMQLHTSGWLHKGICSENIMFVFQSSMQPRDIIAKSPYLVGYGYARPDTASAAVWTEMPVSTTNRDLYRHPDARGETRQTFQVRFDMYGLACVLTELAFWEHLEDVLRRYRSWTAGSAPPSLNEVFGDFEFQQELSFYVSQRYIEAIERCLRPKEAPTQDHDAALETDVLEILNSCKD